MFGQIILGINRQREEDAKGPPIFCFRRYGGIFTPNPNRRKNCVCENSGRDTREDNKKEHTSLEVSLHRIVS